mmetsp:Transcript_6270/g.12732  ORF Transcript_6270/g.12732 Transcript_6270/m.12732 type:complete len:264 (-) Transcript_6270:292-1083(-)
MAGPPAAEPKPLLPNPEKPGAWPEPEPAPPPKIEPEPGPEPAEPILGAFEPSGPADPNGAGEVFAAPKPGLDPAPKLGVAPAPNAGDAPALPPKGDDVAVFPAGAFAPRVPVDPNAGGDFAPPNAGVEPAPNAGEVPAPKGLAPPPKAGAVPRPPIADGDGFPNRGADVVAPNEALAPNAGAPAPKPGEVVGAKGFWPKAPLPLFSTPNECVPEPETSSPSSLSSPSSSNPPSSSSLKSSDSFSFDCDCIPACMPPKLKVPPP